MIFYDCSTAPNPRRARMFIAEKGLDIETREVSIADGAQLDPGFLKVNPRATLPVLVTDAGDALTENTAIAAYLEARFPEPPLMGRTADERGLVMMWHAIAEQQCGVPVGEALRNRHPSFENRAIPGPLDIPQIPALADRGLARIAGFWDVLEDRLQTKDWLACDHFTIADIAAFVFTDFARVVKQRIPQSNTATRNWFDRVQSRPSAQ